MACIALERYCALCTNEINAATADTYRIYYDFEIDNVSKWSCNAPYTSDKAALNKQQALDCLKYVCEDLKVFINT
jgi:hypothetical protein